MTPLNMLRAAGLATVAAVGLTQIGLAGPAFADTSTVPPAVAAWFAEEAPQTAADVLGGGAVEIDKANAAADRSAAAYRTGKPTQLHDWNPDFVAGESNAAVVDTDEWVAPLYRNGKVVGTIAATLSGDGQIKMSYADDDKTAGTTLASGAVSGDVVQDAQMGGLVEVDAGGKADGLSAVAEATVDTGEVAELRELVAAAHDSDSWAPDDAGSGSGSEGAGAGSGQLLLGSLVVGAVALLWLFAPRRTEQ